MVESGLPVPQTVRLVPDLALQTESWGEYVIAKPVKGLRGRRVRLVRTEEVGGRYAELSGGGRERMFIQKYIDHVDGENRPFSYRVLTMFGEPLTASARGWVDPRRPLAEIAADPAGRIASNTEGVPTSGRLVKIPDVLALSRRVAAAFPEIPCLGQDIIRQTGTGDLYILETNPGGAIWHLSSQFAHKPGHDPDYAKAKYAQFGALDVVADQLIIRTRAEAS
jgi:glutathione synthase/RimK-type ligase-like ATP-grasp enzyme